MRLTINDVARISGYSKSTVSRVLTQNERVKPETRERILNVIEEMGYSHSELARSMVKGSIRIVLVVVGDIKTQPYAHSICAIEQLLYSAGYMVVICNSEYTAKKEYDYLQMAHECRFAGAILMTAIPTEEISRMIRQMSCPIVLVNRYIDGLELDAVLADNYRGGYIATEYLLKMGHKDILHLGGPRHSTAGVDRERGFRDAMRDAGMPKDKINVVYGDLSFEYGREFANRFWTEWPEVTALFIENDIMTLGFINQLERIGKSVPDDVSLINFDHFYPLNKPAIPVTTVGGDSDVMGRTAAELLLRRIEAPDRPIEKVRVPVDLRMKGSIKKLS